MNADEVPMIITMNQHLECPVCFEYAMCPIYSCSEGHILCGPCKANIAVCPSCRDDNIVVNKLIERILEREGVAYPCRNAPDGCSLRVKPSDMEEHLSTFCDFGQIKCNEGECEEYFSPNDLFQHWIDTHRSMSFLEIFPADAELPVVNGLKTLGELQLTMKLLRVQYRQILLAGGYIREPPVYFELEGHIFFVHQLSKRPESHIWVTMLGEEAEAKKYTFTVTVFNDLNIDLSWKDLPVHNMSCYNLEKVNGLGHTAPVSFRILKRIQLEGPADELNRFEWTFGISISKLEEPEDLEG